MSADRSSESKTLLKTSRFTVEQIGQPLSDGSVRKREVVRHPGSVVIIPVVDDQHVCLIKSLRVGVNETLIELPAGTLDPNEVPEHCAYRELTEETGYVAQEMTHLVTFYPAPGMLDERMHLFLATGLTAGEPAREPGEEIDNMVVTWHDAFRMVANNEIIDAKTIIGLLRYRIWLDGQWA